jgi:polar amino acid transport system substrate-binding protein
MFQKKNSVLAAGIVALALSLSVSGCTNNSQTGSSATAAAVDLTNVSRDERIAATVPESVMSSGTLVIATDPTYPPAEFLGGADGQTPMGFDVDIAKALAARMGLKPEFQNADFANILPSLGDKYDVGVSSFTITSERLKAVNLVSYLAGGTRWVVQKGNPKNLELNAVCGRKVGVETGTIQETAAREMADKCKSSGQPAVDVVTMTSQTDITTRLINGSIDALSATSAAAAYAVSETGGKLEALGAVTDESLVGIAVAKDDTALASSVAEALDSLIADGTYGRILGAWGQGETALKQAEVNPNVEAK